MIRERTFLEVEAWKLRGEVLIPRASGCRKDETIDTKMKLKLKLIAARRPSSRVAYYLAGLTEKKA